LSIILNDEVLATCDAVIEKVPDTPKNLDTLSVVSNSDELDAS